MRRNVACNLTYFVFVEHSKHERCKLGWIAVRKELLVDANESLFGQLTIRTVLSEALVPLSDFLLGKVCILLELGDHVLTELAVLLSHDESVAQFEFALFRQ